MNDYSATIYSGSRLSAGTDKFGGSYSSNSSNLANEARYFRVTDGNVQGNRKSPNPISFRKVRYYDIFSTRHYSYSGYPNSYYQLDNSRRLDGFPGSYTSTSAYYDSRVPWSSLSDRCLRKIFDQMRYGSGNLVVDLAESAQTIRMIRNATSVRKMVVQFANEVIVPRNYSGSRRLKYVTDKWLEHRYGWLPFLSSTYELLRTLSKKVDNATSLAVCEARARYENILEFSEKVPGYAATWAYRNENAEISGRLHYKVRMKARSTLEIYDFTSLNPLGIAWELTPLSFVADWFTNIGDTLSLWEDTILFANRFVDGFKTTTYLEHYHYSYNEGYSVPPPVWPSGQQKNDYLYAYTERRGAHRLFKSKTRERLLSLPSPGGLRVEVNLNAKRLLDAAALIRGAFGNPRLK